VFRSFREEEIKAEDVAAKLAGMVECHRCAGSGEQMIFGRPYIIPCPLCKGKRWIKKLKVITTFEHESA
jgi:hypothetical protein